MWGWGGGGKMCGVRSLGAVPAFASVHVWRTAGGLLYELLTAGTHPFAWLRANIPLMYQRRRSGQPVAAPGFSSFAPGLLNMHVLEAADLDRQRVPWALLPDLPGLPTSELEVEAQRLMVACLHATASSRPRLSALLESLTCVFGRKWTGGALCPVWVAECGMCVLCVCVGGG